MARLLEFLGRVWSSTVGRVVLVSWGVLAVVAVGLLFYPGSGSAHVSKQKFLDEANAICARYEQRVKDALTELSNEPDLPHYAEGMSSQVLPIEREELAELRRLPRPKSDTQRIGTLLNDFEGVIGRLDADLASSPNTTVNGPDPFERVNAGLRAYGLNVCGSEERANATTTTATTNSSSSTTTTTNRAPTPTGSLPVDVPDVAGQDVQSALRMLQSANLMPVIVYASSSTIAKDSTISTSPAGGSQVAQGTTVTIVVSSGPAPVTVPDVRGQTEAAATRQLESAGLAVSVIHKTESYSIGLVISQDPEPGSTAPSGSAIILTVAVSAPPTTATTPGTGTT